jgi:hypothetical protein
MVLCLAKDWAKAKSVFDVFQEGFGEFKKNAPLHGEAGRVISRLF